MGGYLTIFDQFTPEPATSKPIVIEEEGGREAFVGDFKNPYLDEVNSLASIAGGDIGGCCKSIAKECQEGNDQFSTRKN